MAFPNFLVFLAFAMILSVPFLFFSDLPFQDTRPSISIMDPRVGPGTQAPGRGYASLEIMETKWHRTHQHLT
jgi:hypothetical protein